MIKMDTKIINFIINLPMDVSIHRFLPQIPMWRGN